MLPSALQDLTRLALEEGCGEAPAPAPQHVPGGFYAWSPAEEMEALADVREEEVKGEHGRARR